MKHYSAKELTRLARIPPHQLGEAELLEHLRSRLLTRLRAANCSPVVAKATLATEIGVTVAQLSHFLRTGRGLERIAERLGYRRVVRYERIS